MLSKHDKLPNFVIYADLPNCECLVWNFLSKKITMKKKVDLKENDNKFRMPKGYEKRNEDNNSFVDKECLQNYVNDFLIWNVQLRHHGVRYSFFYNDIMVGKHTFHRNASKYYTMGSVRQGIKSEFYGHDEIDFTEFKWIQNCRNGGLMYFNEKKANTKIQSYGYDFNLCYQRLLGETGVEIPTKKGYEHTLFQLPEIDNIPMGYYNVRITSTLKKMKKLFSFSPSHTYTHIDLQWAMERKMKYDQKESTRNKIQISLILEGRPNAYIYEDGNTVNTKDIGFKRWLSIILDLREKCPGNKLVKMLAKTVWGSMTQRNIITKSHDEIYGGDFKVTSTDTYGDLLNPKADYVALNQYTTYELEEESGMYVPVFGKTRLLDVHKPFTHNIRIKAFLTSHARLQTAKVALNNISKVIRIQTDNVVFSEPQDFQGKFPTLLQEEKTTGNILWKNVNRYTKSDE